MSAFFLLSFLFSFAFAEQPDVVDLGGGKYIDGTYRGPLIPAGYRCIYDDCRPYEAAGYTVYADGRLLRPDGTASRWGHIPTQDDISDIENGVKNGDLGDDFGQFVDNYKDYAYGRPFPQLPELPDAVGGGFGRSIGEFINENSSAAISIINLALNKGRIQLPPSMERAAQEMRHQLDVNERIRNDYLPSMSAQLNARLREMDAHQINNNKAIIDWILERGANLKAPNFGKPVEWDDYILFKMDKETADLIARQYLHLASTGNFEQSVLLIDKLLYSDVTPGKIPGVNGDGVFVPEEISPELGASPLSERGFATPKNSASGQRLRRVANGYQGQWAAWTHEHGRGGLRIHAFNRHEMNLEFLSGLAFLRHADFQFEIGNPIIGEAYLLLAKGVLDHIRGTIDGFKESLQGAADLLPFLEQELKAFGEAVRKDPAQILYTAWDLLLATPRIGAAVGRSVLEATGAIYMGNGYERGRVLGGLALDALASAVTAGTFKGVAAAGKAAAALRKTTDAVKTHLAYERLARRVIDPIVEQAKVIDRLTPDVPADKKVDLAESYNALLRSGRPGLIGDAEEIIQQMSRLEGEDFDIVRRAAVSQVDPENRARFFNGKEDIQRILETAQKVRSIVANEQGRAWSGYVSRVSRKEIPRKDGSVIRVEPGDLNKMHGGSAQSNSRVGMGGPAGVSVLSYGAGATEHLALATALAEHASYFPNIAANDLVRIAQKVDLENVLVLDKSALAKYGLPENFFSLSRDVPLSYEAPQVLGILTNGKFDGVLLKSAENPSGDVLHSFRGGL